PADWCELTPAIGKRNKVTVPATVPCDATPANRVGTHNDPADDFVVYRASAWANKQPISVEYDRGSDVCMSLVRDLATGFCLSEAQIRLVLRDWNARCQPPWSEAELAHKITSVIVTPDPRGRRDGYLRDVPRQQRQSSPLPAAGGDGASATDYV